MPIVEKIISGGQTGVDRAALDIGLELGIDVGGYCPKGRKAEDGCIPACYPLSEIKSSNYTARTELNVKESDGTLILNVGKLSGGTSLTAKYARKYNKPYLVVQLNKELDAGHQVREWIAANSILILNVAGPREAKRPGVHEQAVEFLKRVFNAPPEATSLDSSR
jgi:hypothetical protein